MLGLKNETLYSQFLIFPRRRSESNRKAKAPTERFQKDERSQFYSRTDFIFVFYAKLTFLQYFYLNLDGNECIEVPLE